MTVGEFLRLNNYRQFDHVLRRIESLPGVDPAEVFGTPMPGFLGRVTESIGAWRGREQRAFDWAGAGGTGKAVGPQERARLGFYDKKHIVGLPGITVAGDTHWVRPEDFLFGGMDGSEAVRRAARPRLEWNRLVAEQLMDTVTQGAFKSATDDFSDDFAWSATSQNGATITQDILTDDADQVGTVVANSTQTMLWPLRDGTETATGHDHLVQQAGAAWTLALGRTARDLITEHPGNGVKVDAYVGINNANDIRALMKNELGAVESRREFIDQAYINGGGFGDAAKIVDSLEGVTYYYSPDIPADIAVYVAANKRPFYLSVGQIGTDGAEVETGAWSEAGNNETRGLMYGYRQTLTMGCKDPTAVAVVEYTA